MKVKNNIAVYDDYRKFLTDYFKEQKESDPFFSLRKFTKMSQFKSAGFFIFVMKGERNLSFTSIKKVSDALKLRGVDAKYFESLVLYNQSENFDEKEKHFKILERIRKKRGYSSIDSNQVSFYKDWYNQVIKELVVNSDWNGDYKKLASMVIPAITVAEAQVSVEALVKAGLIKKDKDGQYIQVKESLSAKGLPLFMIKKARRDYMTLGVEAADNFSKEQRHISALTGFVGEKSFSEITKIIEENREKISYIMLNEEDETKERVMQVNFQFFPLSKNIKRGQDL